LNTFPLVNPNIFHDACGIGFISTRSGKAEERILPLALSALKRLSHRGAKSFDEKSGDGAGILIDLPIEFFKMYLLDKCGIKVKKNEDLAIAMVFESKKTNKLFHDQFLDLLNSENLKFLNKRKVPTESNCLGKVSKSVQPLIFQYIISYKKSASTDIEKKLYFIRKAIENKFIQSKRKPYFCSFSSKNIVYKGLMSSFQLDKFYRDLTDKNFITRMAIFHERFSTNTYSSWEMAQPFRMIAHNGEFNTIKGSRLWMKAREANIHSKAWGKSIESLKPILNSNGSDSESCDNLLEFLKRSGRGIFESTMIMIPDSYNQIQKYYNNDHMTNQMKDYFIYHENFMKPWDGPAALVFSDGDFVGAKMDRNGLRPLRYTLTKCGLVIMASEAGVVDVNDDNLVANYHMKSEEIFGINLKNGAILQNKEIKITEASKKKYGELVKENIYDLKRYGPTIEFSKFKNSRFYDESYNPRKYNLGLEDVEKFLKPMSEKVSEPIGSMGDDTPLAIISNQKRKFYDYFKQQFAQVTNPPIDSLREKSVMSLLKFLGSEDNLLNKKPSHKTAIKISGPVLSTNEIEDILSQNDWFQSKIIQCKFSNRDSLVDNIDTILKASEKYAKKGYKIIFLSDFNIKEKEVPIPMPLIVSAVHNYLIKKKLRSKISIVSISGDAVEDHHFAVLAALGASAIYPIGSYQLIYNESIKNNPMIRLENYRHSVEKGLLKIMSKMGISTFTSYHGSMLLHSIGLGEELSKSYFPALPSNFGGLDIVQLENSLMKDLESFQFKEKKGSLKERGLFRYRKYGELHGFNPTQFKKIHSISDKRKKYKISKDLSHPIYIRDFLTIKSNRNRINIDLVEEPSSILKRFGSGGVSFGAISEKSHRELAKGFALVGARSNTGEGGEASDRYNIGNTEKIVNSYVKQIASGRFGVNTEYLAAAKEIQIKIAQGAKPGEGGQLPGFKVSSEIAATRSSSPGITLISPPPHHDIYSIEDIKQLIYDLKDVNPRAKISVKLVSQPGVGIIAAGVAKAGANIILISGADGGTGASPLGSQKHTGFPWEYGLAETHQTLYLNGLREYVTLRVDGGIKSHSDIIVAAILGAEEFDFGTSALVSLGCVMARQCHLNICPVGIATTDKKYEKRFRGKSEHLANYLKQMADSVREEISNMGFSNLHEIIGRTDFLSIKSEYKKFIKDRKINLDGILNKASKVGLPLKSHFKLRFSNLRRKKTVDEEIIDHIRKEIITQSHVVVSKKIKNTDRSLGARISGELSYLFGQNNFKGGIQLKLAGVAGQSFGAFLSKGMELRLKGLANDYIGKSMSSGIISIRNSNALRKKKRNNTLIGNVALYGATGGELYVAGSAAERFAVRNSGALAVVEGIGNHGCEYMTQGVIIILGTIGKNFGAGMTGGTVYLYSKRKMPQNYINHDFIEQKDLNNTDKNLIYRQVKNHIFHTNSYIGNYIENNWTEEIKSFTKLSPKKINSINFDLLYEKQTSYREL